MLFAKFETETNKQLFPSGSCKYEFENFRHTGPLQSDWSKSVLAPPLSIPKCLPFFHAKSMGLAILSLYYRWQNQFHSLSLPPLIHRRAFWWICLLKRYNPIIVVEQGEMGREKLRVDHGKMRF